MEPALLATLTWLVVPVRLVFINVLEPLPINICPAATPVRPVPPLLTGTVPLSEILGEEPPVELSGGLAVTVPTVPPEFRSGEGSYCEVLELYFKISPF